MFRLRLLRNFDYPLFFAVIILVVMSLAFIYSATYKAQTADGSDPYGFVKKQAFSLCLALALMLIFIYFDYEYMSSAAYVIYGILVFLLLFVLFRGYAALGAQRWIALGPLSFQPSEFAKLGMIIFFAKVLIKQIKNLDSLWSFVPYFALAGIPFLLIFKQPDLGTGLVILVITIGMIFWAQARPILIVMLFTPIISLFVAAQNIFFWLGYIILLGYILYKIRLKLWDSIFIFFTNVGCGLALPLLWNSLKAYQKNRILVFFNPEVDPLGAGYHSIQSKIAIGSGRIFGQGLFAGTQTQLQFIPEQQTDFIFSVAGEELGFMGGGLILGLFAFIIYRGIKIAIEAKDPFGSFLAAGIVVMLMFHVLVNVGMTMGIMPVVGIPLPFMSYGGTSLIMNFIALGILESIAMRREKLFF